eukprot:38458_1
MLCSQFVTDRPDQWTDCARILHIKKQNALKYASKIQVLYSSLSVVGRSVSINNEFPFDRNTENVSTSNTHTRIYCAIQSFSLFQSPGRIPWHKIQTANISSSLLLFKQMHDRPYPSHPLHCAPNQSFFDAKLSL